MTSPISIEDDSLYFIPQTEFAKIQGLNSIQDKVSAFSSLARINCLSMIMKAGSGHIGSSFSSLDIVSWLYLQELDSHSKGNPDIYFSSKGHDAPGLYSVLRGIGDLPEDAILNFRRLEGLPGHPDVGTPGMWANTGSLGMGISKAKGMIFADRFKNISRKIFVMTGDGELQEGQIWESLGSAAIQNMGELIVIVDHNKLQSDTFVKNVSDLGDLEAKFKAFGWEVARCDGHHLDKFDEALRKVELATTKPKIIIADTIKGKGVSFMEHTAMPKEQVFYNFHSGAPSSEHYIDAMKELVANSSKLFNEFKLGQLELSEIKRTPAVIQKNDTIQLVSAYAKSFKKIAATNPNLIALDGDLVLDTGLIPFRDEFPERFIECGIAEQDMVSQAGGIALAGLLPAVHSFACFLTTRANEHFFTNSTEHTKIIYSGFLAGLLPGGPGHSHQSVRDISALAAIPGLVMFQPSCEIELDKALTWASETSDSSVYFRITSVPRDRNYTLPGNYEINVGRGIELRPGKDAILISYGPTMLSEAMKAADILAKDGIDLGVINLPWLNKVDSEWLSEVCDHQEFVFTLDDHFIKGGQGEMIAATLAREQIAAKIKCLGVTKIPVCGTNDEVLGAHGLDAQNLSTTISGHLLSQRSH